MVAGTQETRAHLSCLAMLLLLVAVCGPVHADAGPYRNYKSLRSRLANLARREPNLVRLDALTRSLEGRKVWIAEIGRGADEARSTRPAMLVVAGIEGDDLIGSCVTASWIESLIESYEQDGDVTNLLNTTTLYVVPRLNPDAAENFFAPVQVETNVTGRPFDDDHDGLTDEDGPEDLNADGSVTWMRVRDARGEYALDPIDERLLVKADPFRKEAGAWRYLPEGIDSDHDGKWNEDAPGGVNLNRNFPCRYAYFASDAGLHPVSEDETRALADFVVDHPNIGIVLTYGAADNLLKCPEGGEPPGGRKPLTAIDEKDVDYYCAAGELFRETFGLDKELEGQTFPGTFSDWMYFHRGRFSVAARPWNLDVEIELAEGSEEDKTTEPNETSDRDVADEKSPEKDKDKRNEKQRQRLAWFDAHRPDAFLAWRPFEHPDFPGRKVEIGGYRPFALTNPPRDRVADVVARQGRFLTALAQKLPRIGLAGTEVKHLGNSVFEVTLCVENKGFLPTVLSHGVRTGAVHPTRVTLGIHDDRILSGRRITYLSPIAGSGATARTRYVLHVPDAREVEFTVVSALAGQFNGTIELSKEQ
ncbi:MAG: hypothetical protein JW741_18155 [Sedimentisphaerales bacterium]|nr:hypothetical protein [Sedimentisphaerales bacterium]